jgi:hypothetical protein
MPKKMKRGRKTKRKTAKKGSKKKSKKRATASTGLASTVKSLDHRVTHVEDFLGKHFPG